MPFLHHKPKTLPRSREIMKKSETNGFRPLVFNLAGDTYCGQWKDGKKTGVGRIFKAATNEFYMGCLLNNQRSGFGVMARVLPNKTYKLTFYGMFKKGNSTAYGIRRLYERDIYEGAFRNGQPHGFGKMLYGDGSFYAGNWKRNERHGLGLFIRSDGNRYEGHFKNNLKHGHGRFYHLNKGIVQEGIWENDVCVLSAMVTMPFRNTSVRPTVYPIPKTNIVLSDDMRRKSLFGDVPIPEEFPLTESFSFCSFE